MSQQQRPTIGQIVHYRLGEHDVMAIDRLHPRSDCNRNAVRAGDVFPAMVVRVFDPAAAGANLQVFLDGDCAYWATSRLEGDEQGQWFWPPRV